MYRVLLTVDESEKRGVKGAKFVTGLPNSAEEVEVTVLNVYKEFDVTGEGGQFDSDSFFDEDEYPESVRAVVEVLEGEGLSTVTRREHGDPNEEILNVARDIDADLIVMGGRKRTPVGKVIFGSVAQKVMLSADFPVTVLMDS